MSRFGRQPAADELRRQNISRVDVAEKLNVKYSILNNTLAGHQTPTDVIREGLAEITGKPVEELFSAEPLARQHGKRYRAGAQVSAGDDVAIVRKKKQKADA